MTLTVELKRSGTRMTARVAQGGVLGEDMLVGKNIKDPEQLRRTVTDMLTARMPGVEVEFKESK